MLQRALVRPVGHEQAARAGGAEGGERLVEREMTARIRLIVRQRGLAHEEIRVAGQIGQGVARAGVAGVGEDGGPVLDTEGVRLDGVVRDAHGRDLEACRPEALAFPVLRDLERLLEHVPRAEQAAELGQEPAAARRHVQLGIPDAGAGPVHRAPDPRHEIAPVVEVEVREGDRLDRGPALALA